MENDIKELLTLDQEFNVLQQEAEVYIKMIKTTEDSAKVFQLGQKVTAIWDKLDDIREYKSQIEKRIVKTINIQ